MLNYAMLLKSGAATAGLPVAGKLLQALFGSTPPALDGTITDDSGNGNDAQVINSNAATFNGTSSVVDCGTDTSLQIADHLSVTVRAKNVNSAMPGNETLLGRWNGGANQRSWVFAINTSEQPYLAVSSDGNSGASQGVYTVTTPINPSNVASYGFTFDGGVVVFYINGAAVASSLTSGSVQSSLHATTQALEIGAAEGATVNLWEGDLWDVRVYEGASGVLSAAQMLAIHNGDTNSVEFTGQTLQGYWPLAEGGGTLHYDVTGNGNDGTGTDITTTSTQDVFHWNLVKGFSTRMNKLHSSNLDSAWTEDAVTLTDGQADPIGGTSAMSIIPSTTNNEVHRAYSVSNVDVANNDYMIMYCKQVGTVENNYAHWKFSVGDNGWFRFSPLGGAASGSSSFVGYEDIGDGWYKATFLVADGDTTLQIGAGPNATNPGTAWQPTQTTDGMLMAFGVVDATTDDIMPTTGTSASVSAKIPALADGSADAVGLTINNPAATGHNGAESEIDQWPSTLPTWATNIFTNSDSVTSITFPARSGIDSDSLNYTTSIDGTETATKFILTTGSGAKYIGQTATLTSGNRYITSWHVKYEDWRYVQFASSTGFTTGHVNFDLVTGTIVKESYASAEYGIEDAGGGWWRVWIAEDAIATGGGRHYLGFIDSASATRLAACTGDGTNGPILCCPMLELVSAGVDDASFFVHSGTVPPPNDWAYGDAVTTDDQFFQRLNLTVYDRFLNYQFILTGNELAAADAYTADIS